MSYIGKEPQFTQYPSKFFNGDGTAMTVTLDYSPPNAAALLVFIDGVRQDTSAYTLSGTSLTFTGTVPSGTNNVQVVHLGLTVDVGVPSDDTISTVKIQDDVVTTAKIADDQVTSAKLANSLNITSGNSLTIDSGATITNNGTASGFGKVLQVVSTFKNDTFSTVNTTTFLDVTGLSATITPSSSSNKILVFFNINVGSSSLALIRLMRDSTEIAPATTSGSHNSGWMSYESGDSNISELCSVQYLDSPATTSAVTYKVQIKNRGSTYTTNVNRTNSDSTDSGYGHRGSSGITLMEIAG